MSAAPHEHPVYKISSLGRPVDPRFPSNKAILIVMAAALVAGAVWGWFDTHAWQDALLRGGHCAVVAFASWALARELDPDRPHTAMIAVALCGAALVWQGQVDLWTIGAGILAARLVGRTIGPGARVTDLAAVVGVVGLAVFLGDRWTIGLAIAAALVMDALLVEGSGDRWAWALGCVAIVVGYGIVHPIQLGSTWATWMVAAVTLAALLSIATLPAPKTDCDQPGHALDRRRVQGGMFAVLLVGLLAQLEASSAPLGLGVAACLLATLPGRAFSRGASAVA